jgi:membrane peptidoglycan carboxypeptidase
VKVEAKVGVPLITHLEIAAGLTSLAQPGNRPAADQYAATLGGIAHGISPLELATGASTIASLGIHHSPAPVLKITDRPTGKVVYAHDAKAEGQRVVPANVAYIITQITSNDNNRAAAFGANGPLTLPDRRVSAKTGTAENFKANWTVGWTPSLLTVVMVGNPYQSCLNVRNANDVTVALQHGIDPTTPLYPREVTALGLKPVSSACGPLAEGLAAAIGAAPIWHSFMVDALAGTPGEWYQRPPDLVVRNGNDDNADFFLPGTENNAFTGPCVYWGPAPIPDNPCNYIGTTPPPPTTGPQNPPATPAPTPKP